MKIYAVTFQYSRYYDDEKFLGYYAKYNDAVAAVYQAMDSEKPELVSFDMTGSYNIRAINVKE